jgi:hypothetical protein
MATNLHVISGVLVLNNKKGDARVNFMTGDVTGDATADPGQPIRGYGHTFRSTPHVIVSPTDLTLSTKDNTSYKIDREVRSDALKVMWNIDSARVRLQIDFLVIGEPGN